MKIHLLIGLVLLIALSGCGGGGTSSDDPDNPPQNTAEWTFQQGNTTTMAAWSAKTSNSEINGVSAVLRGDGQISVISIGDTSGTAGIIGSTTGTVNPDGSFTTTTGSIRATGTLTHEAASIRVYRPDDPDIYTPMNAATTPAADYTEYRGTWSGVYKINDGAEYTIAFTINECGFITGTISEGPAAGNLYGRVNEDAGTVIMTIPSQIDISQIGWRFASEGSIQPDQVVGTITSHDPTSNDYGDWSAAK